MASTGSVSSWDEALLTAMIQYPVPVITGPEDIQIQVDKICKCLASTKAGYPGLDLIVFPEYSTQGLNTKIWTYDEMLLRIDSRCCASICAAAHRFPGGKRSDIWIYIFLLHNLHLAYMFHQNMYIRLGLSHRIYHQDL